MHDDSNTKFFGFFLLSVILPKQVCNHHKLAISAVANVAVSFHEFLVVHFL